MFLACAALTRAEVVDRIVFVVGERIVTASDIAFEGEFDARDRSPLPILDDPAYAIEDRLVDYAVIRDLAGDVELFRPTEADLRGRWAAFYATWDRAEDHGTFLARWGLDDETLRGFLYSRLVVERYVARNAQHTATPEAYRAWIAELRGRVAVRRLRG